MSNIKVISPDHTQSDGILVGNTGDKIAFAGATPVVRPVGAAQAAVVASSTDATMAGAANLAAVQVEGEKIGDDVRACIVLVNKLRTDLIALGLIKGAA